MIALPTDDRKTLSEQFGRAKEFALYTSPDAAPTYIEGGHAKEHGAGTASVSRLVEAGVTRVVAPHLGPKAEQALAAAGIVVIAGKPGTPLVEWLSRGEKLY